MKTVSLSIDGKRIFADEGTTILEAARQNGIEIPTLCYHPRLKPLGHCRVCIVKVDGIDKPITSCDNPITEGMVVKSVTPEIQKMREEIIALSLATHPYKDCLTCERTGTCELQENAYQLQVNLPEQLERELEPGTTSDNPYIVRDEEKCILCGRCIQTCRTMVGCSVFSLVGNGVNTRVVPYKDGEIVSMEEAGCIFCGQCVDVCPVSALTEKKREAEGREWQLDQASGVCIECSLSCNLTRQASKNGLARITVEREGENVSWICQKGKFEENNDVDGFIKKPLISEKGSFREVEYDEAINKVADKLKSVVNQSGPDSVAFLSSGKLSNEEAYLLQKLARNELGMKNINLGVDQYWADAYKKLFSITGPGVCGPNAALLRHAETILVVGSGLENTHPVAAMAIGQAARHGSATIVRISSENNSEKAWKEITVKTKPGKEGLALKSIAAVLTGNKAGKEAKESGIDEVTLNEAALALKGANTYLVVSPDFVEVENGSQVDALIEFSKDSGHIGKGYSRLLLLSSYSNATGIINMGGSPYCGPGLVSINGKTGMNSSELNEALGAGKIKAILTFGSEFNDLNTTKTDVIAAFCKHRDDAPANAGMLIPMVPIENKEGTFTGSDGVSYYNEMALAPNGLKEDWVVISDLARAVGANWKYTNLDDVQDEIEKELK